MNRIRKRMLLAVVFLALAASIPVFCSAQLAVGLEFPSGSRRISSDPFITLAVEMPPIGLKGGIWWPSVISLGQENSFAIAYVRGILDIGLGNSITIGGAAGMEFLFMGQSGLPASRYQLVVTSSLEFSPFSLHVDVVWSSPTSAIEFSAAQLVFGLSIAIGSSLPDRSSGFMELPFYRKTTAFMRAGGTVLQVSSEYREDFEFRVHIAPDDPEEPASECGIVFRYVNRDNFYVITMRGDGFVRMRKRLRGEWIDVTSWQSCDAYKKREYNHLAVVASGNHFQVLVNGAVALEAHDAAFENGRVGLSFGTWTPEKATGRFVAPEVSR